MKSASPETFRALWARVRTASTREALAACETQTARHYDNRTITPRELARLDVRIMEKLATL